MSTKGYLILGAAGLVVVYFAFKGAEKTAGDALSAVNPMNENNIFITGVNSVTEALTGEPTLGGYVYDLFN